MCSKECDQKDSAVKLLFLLPSFTFGGAERTSLNLLRGIDKSRFRVCLITSRKIFSYFEHIEIEKFLAVEDLGIETWFGSLKTFIRDIRSIALLIKREQPDLAFGMMHYPSSLLVFAKKIFRFSAKVIVSPRGPSKEYLRYFEAKMIRKLSLKLIFSFFCKYADGIVVSSEGMKEECVKNFHAVSERVRVIPNSLDFSEIAIKAEEKADLEISAGIPVISVSGRIEREKNLPYLLRAFCAVRKKKEARLLFIGDGKERNNLERISQELSIGSDVIFVGYQSNPYKFIKNSDIFVHTCLFEGFANSIIEAMACGVPVIAVDCPYGPRSIITHGKNGLLVPMDDEETLADAILKLLNDRGLRNALVAEGYQRAADFSVGKMVEGYEGFFNRIALDI